MESERKKTEQEKQKPAPIVLEVQSLKHEIKLKTGDNDNE